MPPISFTPPQNWMNSSNASRRWKPATKTLPLPQEEKLANQHRSASGGLRSRTSPTMGHFLPPSPPTSPLLPSLAKPPPPNVRHLTPKEMTVHQKNGLCFNCDEKFTRGHKCSSRLFLLIANSEEEEDTPAAIPNISPNISDSLVPDPN